MHDQISYSSDVSAHYHDLVLAQTMEMCNIHNLSNFIFREKNGKLVKVCEKCVLESEQLDDT
jgi:hypothetical protein